MTDPPVQAAVRSAGERRARPPAAGPSAVHVIAGLGAEYGGPSYSVPRLGRALAARGARISLLAVAAANAGASETEEGEFAERRFPWDYASVPALRGLRASRGLAAALRRAASDADIVHDHGLWLMPNLHAGWEAARAGKPLIVSPRGMLSPTALAFSRAKKRLFWGFLQGEVVRRAACLHATSPAEYEDIRAYGLRNPVAVVANGIDVPAGVGLPEPRDASRTLLTLGRIHAIKGLDCLLHAWARLEPRFPDWRLRIVGSAEAGHDVVLGTLAAQLGLARVSIEGPIYGEAKHRAYREADLFVLPSSSENFGLTVAEALAAETPAISTKGTPWSGLVAEGCGWWIDLGVEPLAAALAEAMARPRETLGAMGRKGRAWVAREFSWDRVARDMLEVYRWVLAGGDAPATVRLT